MDFLSYMTLKLAGDRTVCLAIPCDYLVMNSVNNLKKTLARLQEYSDIHCYLDNDLAGQRTTETIAGMYGGRVSDESCHYAEYKVVLLRGLLLGLRRERERGLVARRLEREGESGLGVLLVFR